MSDSETFPLLTSAEQTKLRRNLRRWHLSHGRDLPWRNSGDAYRVWISEIMLQQTTVAAVVPYYERFLERFPDVHALAKADEADVLKLWEGLGYYSRARNIHKTARIIQKTHGGHFPSDVDALQSLPGIGRYTAGAIASFAFDRRAPIVEANTLRLYCRLLGFDGDPRSTIGQHLLWSFAEQTVPAKSPGEFNQALMDLGATICTVTDPDCVSCPLKSVCRAFHVKRVDQIPRPKERPVITEVVEASIAVHRRGKYLLRRRNQNERWAGLWDFLRFELPAASPAETDVSPAILRGLVETVRGASGLDIELPSPVRVMKHSVTRYLITLHCLQANAIQGRLSRAGGPFQWVKASDFGAYPLSVTGRKFARLLE